MKLKKGKIFEMKKSESVMKKSESIPNKVTAVHGYILGGDVYGISSDPWHDAKTDPPEREDGYLVYMENENPGYLLAMWDPETKIWYYYDWHMDRRIELEDQDDVRYWMDIPLVGDTTKTIVEWCRKEEGDI